MRLSLVSHARKIDFATLKDEEGWLAVAPDAVT